LAGAILLIVFQDGIKWNAGLGQYKYAGYVVIATLCYATSVNVVKKFLQDVPSIRISSFSFVMVGMPVWFMIPFSGIPESLATLPQAWPALGYLALLALFGTVLATVIFYRLVQETNVVFSSSVAYLIPVVAVLLGLVDGELFNAWQGVGMIMIISGVYLTRR
jgi:drug/metabolite transporter (DMT)-like permease